MDFQRYADLFWVNIHAIFCILDDNTPQEEIDEMLYQLTRFGVDDKVILCYVTDGTIHSPNKYFQVVHSVCKVFFDEEIPQDLHQPIVVFKGCVRFVPYNLPKLLRVATAMNIYNNIWDIFSLACEESTFSREILRNDVYEGSPCGEKALLLSPKTIRDLACLKPRYYKSMTMSQYMSSKKQFFLSQPICYL
jgi:hypothetical protein